jgi:hypothetical protein
MDKHSSLFAQSNLYETFSLLLLTRSIKARAFASYNSPRHSSIFPGKASSLPIKINSGISHKNRLGLKSLKWTNTSPGNFYETFCLLLLTPRVNKLECLPLTIPDGLVQFVQARPVAYPKDQFWQDMFSNFY